MIRRWEQNLCHQQSKLRNVNLACYTPIFTLSFLNNWKWDTLYEKQKCNQCITAMCYTCLKFTIQLKVIILSGLIVFLFQRLNVFNLSAGTKNLKTNYTLLC